jgi:hypothetical protein
MAARLLDGAYRKTQQQQRQIAADTRRGTSRAKRATRRTARRATSRTARA